MAVERQAVHVGRCPTLQSSRPGALVRSLAAAHRDVRTQGMQLRRVGLGLLGLCVWLAPAAAWANFFWPPALYYYSLTRWWIVLPRGYGVLGNVAVANVLSMVLMLMLLALPTWFAP